MSSTFALALRVFEYLVHGKMSRRECGYESCFDIASIRRPAGQGFNMTATADITPLYLKPTVYIKQGPQGTTPLQYIVSHCITL